MQSILYKNSNLMLARKYLQSLANIRGNKLQGLIKPLGTTLSNNQFQTIINKNNSLTTVHFANSKYLKNNQESSSNDQNSDKSNKNESEDDRKKRMEDIGKRIGMLSIVFAFFYLNLSYLQEVEQMRQKMEEKDRELEEEKKRKASGVITTENNVNNKIFQSRNISNTTNTVKSTLITWNEFVAEYLAKENVLEIVANRKSDLVMIRLKRPVEFSRRPIEYLFVQIPPDMLENKLEQAQEDLNLENRVYISYKENAFTSNLITFVIVGSLFLIMYRFGRAALNKMQNMQKEMFSQYTDKKFQMIDPHLKQGAQNISFKDVAGLHEAKVEIKEFVEYLNNPERFKKLGAKVPKGALLTGPPGCGKTLLAKAVASEANVPFFNVAGTEFIEMIGGVGASRVRTLFEEARKHAPSIVFIDEIDAIGRKRSEAGGSSAGGGGSGEFDQTLNQLLVSMDGLESSSNVVVLASTNRADILDKALLRPGRLDRIIDIDLPTQLERIEMLNVHLRNLKVNFSGKDRDEFIAQLSHLTPGFSGADLANICNESALMAARDGQSDIDKKNFYSALERVIAGAEKKNSIISVEDKKLIAYRECGKIIVSWYHEYAELILKVSLISRTKMNAFSQFLPSDQKLYSKDELFDQLCLHVGGRAAEVLIFNKLTTTSEADLKRVTNMAYTQVESLGMSDVIGNMSFPTRAEEIRSSGQSGQRPYSKKLRNTIDLEVNKLITSAHDSTVNTLNKNMENLHKLAAELLKRESLSYQDIVEILGEPVNNKKRYKVANQHLTTES